MANSENGLTSRIFSVFWSVFCAEQLEMICRIDFDMFFGILILFLTKCEEFAWAIAFA